MPATVLLFDIDGTLLPTLGLGRRAMEQAFVDLLGRHDALAGVRFEGMTDRPIVRAGFRNLGVDLPHANTDELIDQILARYLRHLRREVDAHRPLPVLPGVLAALDAAANWADTAVGLGTGNLRDGAELKLRGADLWERFTFGGYACDHEDRAELLRLAAARGAARLGRPPHDCRVVVIGDTPRDVSAAQAIGAESIALATSRYAVDELRASGATHAFADMTADGFLPALRG